jgi:hypothetical protein
MRIVVTDNQKRILINSVVDTIVNIDDGDTVEYMGVYYKRLADPLQTAEIKTKFIGTIECQRYHDSMGITGIYIKPLYIWHVMEHRWRRIINYHIPTNKYFVYPHLLLLPDTYYNYKPLYTLDTCKNISLEEVNNVIDTFDLYA